MAEMMDSVTPTTSDVRVLIIGAGKKEYSLYSVIIAHSLRLGVTGLLIAHGLKKVVFTHCTLEQRRQV
jgi:hypothetical protein